MKIHYSISSLLLIAFAGALCALPNTGHTAQLEPDQEQKQADFVIELIAANPDAGFNYPYLLRIPKTLSSFDKTYLIVESNNSGVTDNMNAHIDNTRAAMMGYGPGPLIAGELLMPLLMPVFPRNESQSMVYTHALDQDTLRIEEGPQTRLDRQLVQMAQDAKRQLKRRGVLVEDKFVLVGFSASGTFSNRFAFIHPNALLAVVSGAVNAFPMLPISEIDSHTLPYPLGLGDFDDVTGKAFNRQQWNALPQFIFMGAIDDNDALQYRDAFSDEERSLVFSLVGSDMASRWSKAQLIYLQQKANTTLVTYGQVGHWTNGRIHSDMVNFVRSAIIKNILDGASANNTPSGNAPSSKPSTANASISDEVETLK